MTTITKERLLTIQQWRETYGPGSNVVLPAEEAEELARIALVSLEAGPVAVSDDMAYAFHHALSDSSPGADEVEEIKAGLRAAFANVTIQPEPVVPDEIALAIENLKQKLVECNRYNYCADAVKGVEDACHAAMLQGIQPVSQTYNLPELIEGMEVSIDVSTCDADLGNRYFGTVTEALELDTAKNGYILLVQDAEPNFDVNGNSPVIPGDVLSAILKVARVRADFDDFDGDRRGIGDCLDEAEQELIVTINKYASQLAAEPIATNDVREQTAVPPVPVIQADVAQAIEKLKRKLVECNRYNYCADAVKGVEYACHAAMLQGSQPVSQTYKFPVNTPCQDAPAHIWLQTAGVWPEDGELSELTWCSHNQHHDDTLYVRADLVNGNSQVTPDGWISCSERMPAQDDWILIYSKHGEYMAGQVQGEYVELSDGTLSWLGNALFWMLLPEPPQEAGQ